MVIISYAAIREFIHTHPRAKDALNNWHRYVNRADWPDFHQMKRMFNHVDAIGNDRYVFNIRGNHYRLIALIFFDIRTVYIRFVGTHSDYDSLIDCSSI